jgi:isopentenyl-diphosphate delta-isomerase
VTIRSRKEDHLRLALEDVEAHRAVPWEEIELLHDSVPELDYRDVDISCELLGRRLGAPFVISGMTGGHSGACDVNARLARVASRFGLAMGVGSQRAAILDPTLRDTFRVARAEAPDVFLLANLGVAQLVEQESGPALGLDDVRCAIDMIRADALAVHLNFLEEVVQPEGDRNARGCLEAIGVLVHGLGPTFPVVAKETGSGLSPMCAAALAEVGVAALDVGGRGGTTFAAVEGLRAAEGGDEVRSRLGQTFRDWGIPTPVSVIGAVETGIPVIASGGIRSGYDAARALALGANAVGIARPVLRAALQGEEALVAWVEAFLAELRTALFLTSSRSVGDLHAKPIVVLGNTLRWCDQLGLHPAPRREWRAREYLG